MNNPKIPTRIVDKNGKQTTVHRSVEKSNNKVGRDITKLNHGTTQNSPIDKLERAIKRVGLPKDTNKLSILVRGLGSGSVTTAGERYDAFVRLVSTTYGVDKHKAIAAADAIYIAAGVGDSIKIPVHYEVLRKAANKKLVENHKVRFPRENLSEEKNQLAPVNSTSLSTDAAQNIVIDSGIHRMSTIDGYNALMSIDSQETLVNIKGALMNNNVSATAQETYGMYYALTQDINDETKKEAISIVLRAHGDDNSSRVITDIFDS